MLIFLEDSIITCIPKEGENGESPVLQALEIVAMAHREGKHFVSGSRNLLQRLAKHRDLSRNTRATYNGIMEQLTQMGTLRSYLEAMISVAALEIPYMSRIQNGVLELRVPITHFKDSATVQPSYLLAENLSDCVLYTHLAIFWMRKQGLRGLPLHVDHVNGGGATTAKVYKKLEKEKNRPCICVIDSDKKSPNSSKGTTCKSFDKQILDDVVFSHLHVLKCREAENLIPTRLFALSVAPETNKGKNIMNEIKSEIETLRRLEEDGLGEGRSYIDIKQSNRLIDLIGDGSTPEIREFWDKIVEKIGKKNGAIRFACAPEQANCNPDTCKCIAFGGLGSHILEMVNDCLRNLSPNQIDELLSANDCHLGERIAIGKIVASFGIASKRTIS